MFEWLFRCKGCEAAQFHIASLKEELRAKESLIEGLLTAQHNDSKELLMHFTGISRMQQMQQPQGELRSFPRNKNSMADRIARAEASERLSDEQRATRQAEYDKRIKEIMPETEVIENEPSNSNG